MPREQDLVAAATTLSTASDGFSVKVDTLIEKINRVVETIPTGELSPEGAAAIEALKTASAKVVTQGDKVDAEVLKLDGILPTPAPAGEPV